MIKKILILSLFSFLFVSVDISFAATYYSRQAGNWNATTTWSTTGFGGGSAASTPGSAAGDVVIISGYAVTGNVTPINALASITIDQSNNTGNDTKLDITAAGITITCNALTITENNRDDHVDLALSSSAILQVNGNVNITRSTSNTRDKRMRVYLQNTSRMNVTGSFTYTYGRADDDESNTEVQLDNTSRLDVNGAFTVNNGNTNGDNNNFNFQMNNTPTVNLGSVSLNNSNSDDGDDIIFDLNGGTMTVSGTYVATVNSTCTNRNSISLYIDGATMSTASFTYFQSGGGNGDMSIFMNSSTSASAASLTVNGNLTYSHTSGDNMEIETNANATISVTGNMDVTMSVSSDGDIVYYDLNGGTITVSGSVTNTINSGATNANNLDIQIDGATFNANNGFTINQQGGGSGDAYIYMNANSSGTASLLNITGDLTYTHTGGDNMEIELNTNSTVTVSRDFLISLSSTDGDIMYVDINGGTLNVQRNMTYTQNAVGGNAEDFDCRIDGSGWLKVDGAVSLNHTTGDDILIYLNSSSGTTAKFTTGSNFNITHTGTSDDMYIQLNGSSQFTVTGTFTVDNNASGDDYFEIELNSTPTFSAGAFVANLNTGAAGTDDDINLDINGGLFSVATNMTITTLGGDDINITIDGSGWLDVDGATTINQTASDDVIILLNTNSGTTAKFTTGTSFALTHTSGNDMTFRLDGSSQFTVGTTFTANNNASGGDYLEIELNTTCTFSVGSNFTVNLNTGATATDDDILLDINGGTLSVTGNMTINGLAGDDLYIQLDGSGQINVTGSVSINHTTGDDLILYLNNGSGTTAQFNVGSDFTLTHTGTADDMTIQLNGSSQFTVGGTLTVDNNASGGDPFELEMNNTPTFSAGNIVANLNTGATGTADDIIIDINGGSVSVSGNMTLKGDSGDDVDVQIDGNSTTFTVAGTSTLDHNGGDAMFVYLGVNTGSPTFTTGALVIDDAGGGTTEFREDNSTTVQVNGNVTLTAAAAAQSIITLNNTSYFKLTGNFVRAATPSRYGRLVSASGATVEYNGTAAAQTIAGDAGSGGDAFTYGGIKINNTFGTSPQLLMTATEGNVTIPAAGTLTLTSGIVSASASAMFLIAHNGSATSGSATSFVDGPMKKTGNSAFTFPIGNGGYWARLYITGPGGSADAFTAQYTAAAYSDLTTSGISKVSQAEYWKLDRNSGASNVSVRLYWENTARSSITDFLTTDLRVARYNGADWVDGGQSSILGGGAGYVTSTIESSFNTYFTFGSLGGTNPLPIELLSFDAQLNTNQVDLSWSTATETNNDYFTIEKTRDAINYETVDVVDGAGNSTSVLNYRAVDNSPYEGVSYYRLKQTDFNGNHDYSDLVAIEYNPSNIDFSFNVYPNPANGETINLSINGEKGQEVLVVVYDLTGRESYSKVVITENSSNYVCAIDPSNKLSPGVYMITATSKQSIYSKKLVVK